MISKVKSFTRTNSLLVKILLSYIIIGAVLISILSFSLFNSFSASSVEEINTISQKMLGQYYNVYDTLLTSVYSYFFQLYSKDSLIFNAMYAKSFDPVEVRDINQKLVNEVFANPWIYSIYIYNASADRLFSNWTPVRSMDEFYDQDILKYIKANSPSRGPIFIPRHTTYTINDKSYERNFITIMFYEQPENGRPEAALVVNVNQQDLQNVMSWRGADEGTRIFVLNQEGVVISHPDSDMINRNLSGREYIKSIQESKLKQGHFTTEVEGEKSLVTFIKSEKSLGWNFVSIGGYKKLLNRVNVLQYKVYLLTVAFVFLGLLTAAFFTTRIYIPMYRLIRKLKSGNSAQQLQLSLSEYDYLFRTFDHLQNNVKSLSTSVSSYLPAKRRELLRQLLQGEIIRMGERADDFKFLKIDIGASCFCVIVLRIDAFFQFCRKNSIEDVALFRFAIENIASEVISPEFQAELLEGGQDHVTVILQLENASKECEQRIQQVFEKILVFIKEYLDFTCTAAIGDAVDDIKDIQSSYRNALARSNYRLLLGRQHVIGRSDIPELEKKPFEYPVQKEKQLLDAFKMGDSEKVGKYLDEMLQYFRAFSFDQIMHALTQLALASDRTAAGILDNESCYADNGCGNLVQELEGCDTLDEIHHRFLAFYCGFLEIFDSKKGRRKEEIVSRIVEYIKNCYHDPNLTVEMVSEQVSLSPNYVRTIFKDLTNESLSAFIARIRLDKARKLLDETDYPANKISEMVGFQSSGYFYANFRKHTGKTPDQYRKEARRK